MPLVIDVVERLHALNCEIARVVARQHMNATRLKAMLQTRYEAFYRDIISDPTLYRKCEDDVVGFEYAVRHGQARNGRVVPSVRFGIFGQAPPGSFRNSIARVFVTMTIDGSVVRYSKFEFQSGGVLSAAPSTVVAIRMPRDEGLVLKTPLANLKVSQHATISQKITHIGFPSRERHAVPLSAEHLVARYAILGEHWWAKADMSNTDALRYLRFVWDPRSFATVIVRTAFGPQVADAYRRAVLDGTASLRRRAADIIRTKMVHTIFRIDPRIRELLRKRERQILTTADVKRILGTWYREPTPNEFRLLNRYLKLNGRNSHERPYLVHTLYKRLKANGNHAGQPVPRVENMNIPYRGWGIVV